MNERTKNYVGWAIIIGVVLIALSAVSAARSYSQAIEPSSFRSFGVSGEGKATVKPDVAYFTFSVITEGGVNLGELQRQNNERINQAIKFLKEKGIPSEDIKTENYQVSPRYQSTRCDRPVIYSNGGATEVCPPPSIVGYSIHSTVGVKVREKNFGLVGELLSGVVESGANNVSQLNFVLDDPAAAESEARAGAIAQAREKAEAVARAGNFRIGRLLSIEEGYGPIPYYAKREVALGMGGGEDMAMPAPAIEPGSQDVVVTVHLRYEIK